MRHDVSQHSDQRGFTLIELLVVVVLVATLAALLLPLLAQARATALNRGCVSNLENIGQSLQLYTKDHHGLLPGPLWMGQPFEYTERSTNAMAYYLTEYLVTPEPSALPALSKAFLCPAYEQFAPRSLLSAERVSLIANQDLDVAPGEGRKVPPFGYPGRYGKQASQPLDLETIKLFGSPSDFWGLTDADRKNSPSENNPWFKQLPVKPVHGNYRNVLYLDGRVRSKRVR